MRIRIFYSLNVNVNSAYGPDTVTTNRTQFWFRRFPSSNLNVKDAPRSGR